MRWRIQSGAGKTASPLLDGEAPAGWGITPDRTRAEDVLRPAPDVDGRMPRVSKWGAVTRPYSITSSARASSVGGTSRPSAFAVLRLITSSNFVARSTGMSGGLAPLRMRPA